MPVYALFSANAKGTVNTDTRTARIEGKSIILDPGKEIAPGDMVRLGGSLFIVKRITPADFPHSVKRGAQIIQFWDSAFIISYMGVKSGSSIIESGVGTGSMSFSILSALSGRGRLLSVDINKEAIELARSNVSSILGEEYTSIWETEIGDISSLHIPGAFDFCILDVPQPWEALESLSGSLRSGAILCFYCPTFNQVEHTVADLARHGFRFLESHELIDRKLLVRDNATRPDSDLIGHTAFLSFAIKTSGISVKF